MQQTPPRLPALWGHRHCLGLPQTAGCGVWFAGSSDTTPLRFCKRHIVPCGQLPDQCDMAVPHTITSSLHEGSCCERQGWGSQQQPVTPQLPQGSATIRHRCPERDPHFGVEGEGGPEGGRTSIVTPSSVRTALKKIILMFKIHHLFIPQQDRAA